MYPLARRLRSLPGAQRVDEEADLRWSWVPLDTAVAMALSGDIVNATAVAGSSLRARVVDGAGSTTAGDGALGRPSDGVRPAHGRTG